MSGSLRVASIGEERRRHDHVELLFGDKVLLRFYDPRKFGSLHWGGRDPLVHPLLVNLGVEPLSEQFNSSYFAAHCRKTTVPIKGLLLNAAVVVGVGNIYASEALFRAGVNPSRSASSLSSAEIEAVCRAVRDVLAQAVASGGTTLRDYVNGKGEPGLFKDCLMVYGRHGEPCKACSTKICRSVVSNRSSFFCPLCQPIRSL
jgi:formamidopyrimidine-DNA glycosylase